VFLLFHFLETMFLISILTAEYNRVTLHSERLINVHSKGLEEHFGDASSLPKYAILSHAWLDVKEEVSFQGYQQQVCHDLKGYRKIQYTRDQAANDALDYAWIDTCCSIQTQHRRQCPTKRVVYGASFVGSRLDFSCRKQS
jgi:hypothetical protein